MSTPSRISPRTKRRWQETCAAGQVQSERHSSRVKAQGHSETDPGTDSETDPGTDSETDSETDPETDSETDSVSVSGPDPNEREHTSILPLHPQGKWHTLRLA